MDDEQEAACGAQRPAAHWPDRGSQNSEQHAPERAHGWPSDAQPPGARQTGAPVASSAQRNEQQSAAPVQASPSRRHTPTGAQRPPVQTPEQQSAPAAQVTPFGAQLAV
jgi:hypothetical protein